MPTPPSPATFDDLDLTEPLLRGLTKAGFDTPTPVQQQVIPPAMQRLDLLVSAATGSGKTVAFLLPIMQHLLDQRAIHDSPRVLILVPTRELARQIHTHFMDIGSYTRLTAEVITGGENRGHQVSALRRNPDILVATPGRILEHLETGEAELGDLEHLVLDEADRMLDMGFAEQVFAILGHCRRERQSLLFSATLQQRGLTGLAEQLLREPRTIIVDAAREPHPDITHQILLSDEPEHKRDQLLWLLRDAPTAQTVDSPAEQASGSTPGPAPDPAIRPAPDQPTERAPGQAITERRDKTLVFVNTRERADLLGNWLVGQQQRCAVLHGDLDQRERKRVMGLFRSGSVDVLIATDVAARGLDIPGVQRVINFDVPRSGDDYLHRTGRTGRAGEQGIAISLVGASEWNRMEGIQRYLRLDVKQRAIKGLEARFKGAPTRAKPGKKKSAASARAKPDSKTAPKSKQRLRDRKNVGKRRAPTTPSNTEPGKPAGLEPPKRRGS